MLQWVLAFVSFGVWAVGILHGLNAFLLFGLGLMAAAAATRSIRARHRAGRGHSKTSV